MGAMEPDDLEIKSAPYPEEKNLECGGWGVGKGVYTQTRIRRLAVSVPLVTNGQSWSTILFL